MTELSAHILGLKTAFSLLVESLGGTDAAAMALGHKSSSTVSSCRSLSAPDRLPSVLQILRLESLAPAPLVSEWMTRTHETSHAPSKHEICLNDIARCVKEDGDAKMALADALIDGEIDAYDRQRMAKEFREVIALYTELLRAVEVKS